MSPDVFSITNATATRFLFGTFAVRQNEPVFEGSVVQGAGFTYDRTTGLPIAGALYRISLQTRSAERVLATHATLHYPDHDVAVLAHVFDDTPYNWFDPRVIFKSLTPQVPPAAPNDDSTLQLETGDILTREDLQQIFGARVQKLQRVARHIARPDVDFWDIDPDGSTNLRASA